MYKINETEWVDHGMFLEHYGKKGMKWGKHKAQQTTKVTTYSMNVNDPLPKNTGEFDTTHQNVKITTLSDEEVAALREKKAVRDLKKASRDAKAAEANEKLEKGLKKAGKKIKKVANNVKDEAAYQIVKSDVKRNGITKDNAKAYATYGTKHAAKKTQKKLKKGAKKVANYLGL